MRHDSSCADNCASVCSSFAVKTAQFQETPPEFAAHQIVQYRVAGAVQIEHDPAEIEQTEESVGIDRGYVFGGRYHDVEDKEPVRREAHEEADYHRQQHVHHLPPGAAVKRVADAAGRRRVADQVSHDERVQHHEYHERRDEEEQHQQQEERHSGDGVGLREAYRHAIRLIRRLLLIAPDRCVPRDPVIRHSYFAILRHPDHRTAINRKKKKSENALYFTLYLFLDFDEATGGQKKEAAKRDGVQFDNLIAWQIENS